MTAAQITTQPFTWHDGDRTIRFGTGQLEAALASEPALAEGAFALLTTSRAAAKRPDLVVRAAAVHEVASGRVDEVAGELRGAVEGERLVALGGGRVVDVAKALAAADPPREVAAIPTTLSGAEMTSLHRHASGVHAQTPQVRATLVVNDPAVSASQPEPSLIASALNALGHAVEAPLTSSANPVGTLAAHAAAGLLACATAESGTDPDALALGALLAGYAADASGYGLHHVLSQTLARHTAVDHAVANALVLPHSVRALMRRFPDRMEALAAAAGEDVPSLAARLAARTGPVRLRERGVTAEELATCAEEAERRSALAATPPAADRAELLAIYEAAW